MSTKALATPTDSAPPRMPQPRRVGALLGHLQLGRFSGLFFFAAIFLIFSVWVPETFLTSVTWKSILISQAITGILAVGVLAPLATGLFDLSVAQTMGFCALVFGGLTTKGPHLGLGSAIVVTLLVGACIGLFNGFLCGVLGLDGFIPALGTPSLLTGLAAAIADDAYFGPCAQSTTDLTS